MSNKTIYVLAKNINDCSDCPLYKNDCPGGWSSGSGGTPIEPPCCSWNDDDKIYAGMYDKDVPDSYNYQKKDFAEQQLLSDIAKKQSEIDLINNTIKSISKYTNVKVRRSNVELRDDWYCPHCHNWFVAEDSLYRNNVYMDNCPICHEILAHSYILDSIEQELEKLRNEKN